ncbi:Y-family DNA polymerase [Thalassotalea euphylliae]|uniref:DNA polymerase Y family protein n=1 Tax=Thalassotalea euphylliae TaxID=1655234 RepID=A0A3E0TXY3_9GAMM|nr:DNA polymerase Y family protein [Thalassotalea euphylliae]REL29310.1 DNA polymerase Y family protein [Thalassotalea euphylliae]
MSLWLYLHFPQLQLDTIYQAAEHQQTPLIIVNDKNNEVLQLNQLAKNQGITLGMGLGTAASLTDNIQVKVYEPDIETQRLKHIAHWLYAVSADIALYPPNGLLLRVSNMLSLYRDLAHYWQELSAQLRALAVNFHYATGYSPNAARLLARQQLDQLSDNKPWLLAQLKQQKLINSDLDKQIIVRLQRVGVHKLADLLSLSLPELAKRFTIEVVNYIGQLTGDLQHQVVFYIPPEQFEQYLELYFEVSNQQYLTKPLAKLYGLLENYLVRRDKLVTEVRLLLHQRDHADLCIQIGAAQGEYKTDKWLQLTHLKLTSIALAAPVIGISLTAKQIVNKYGQHQDLFKGSQGSTTAAELVSVLSAKLGEDKVKGLGIEQDARPEVANRLCPPFTALKETTVALKLRPSILLPVPLPLQEQVKVMSPPERIVTGWWDDAPINRDYFVACSKQGRWLWLFRDKQQRWFVHGLFS